MRRWAIQVQVDEGRRDGQTSAELAEIKTLKSKVRQLEELPSTESRNPHESGREPGALHLRPLRQNHRHRRHHRHRSRQQPWRYTGGYQDPIDGYYKLGARYYDAAGHFTSADSIAGNITRPEKYNSYTYTAGDPINRTDLSGTYGVEEFVTTVGAFGAFGGVLFGTVGAAIGCVATVEVGCLPGAVTGFGISGALGTIAGGAFGVGYAIGEATSQ